MTTFLWVIVPYVCLAVFVVGHFWRYRYDKFGWTTRSSQLYENRLLRIGSPLFHFGILQKIVGVFARLLRHTMGLGGAEGVAVAANVFMGQSDAPLLIKPYLGQLGRPGLFCVMVAGMTTKKTMIRAWAVTVTL